jgi:L-lactate dehydrogenase complex protein LldE
VAERPRKVLIFHTCLINEVYPEVGISVVRVLESLGIEVEVPPEQTCCGQPAYNAGFQRDARTVARHTISVLQETDDPIVIPSGSCADMLMHQYEVLFHGQPAACAGRAGKSVPYDSIFPECCSACGRRPWRSPISPSVYA